MPDAPNFNVGDIVYLIESAKIGSLESYQVAEVRQTTDGSWIYKISVPQRPPNMQATWGDRVTLRRNLDFELTESELGTYCDAVDLAVQASEANLARLKSIQSVHCSDETGTGGTS